jgi:hypothetical protein
MTALYDPIIGARADLHEKNLITPQPWGFGSILFNSQLTLQMSHPREDLRDKSPNPLNCSDCIPGIDRTLPLNLPRLLRSAYSFLLTIENKYRINAQF